MQLRSAAVRSSLLAMILALVPASAAVGDHADPRGTASACSGAAEDRFTDTGADGSVWEEAVDCISWYEITSGTSPTTYGATEFIRRGQMAKMIAQSMRQSLTRFPEPGDDVNHFPDDDGNMFEPDIDFVAEYGVVRGKAGGVYDPGGFVTRAQMATYLVNQLAAIGVTLAEPSQDYFDDDNDSQHEANINKLAEAELASGTSHRSFSPTDNVTRRQMALFISRDLAELADREFMVRPDQRVEVAADGEHKTAVVRTVERPADTFTVSADNEEHEPERFWYDDNDVFLDPDGNEIATLGEFERALTGPVGDTEADVVDVTYVDDPDGESSFQVVTDNVPPPAGATAFADDHDGDGDRSDVLVEWTGSQQPDVLYDVFRADGDVLTDDTQVAENVTDEEVYVYDEPDGTYHYYVRATSPTTGASSTDAETNEVTLPASGDTEGRPTSEVALLMANRGSDAADYDGEQEEGDVWRFAFDQPLADIEPGDSLTLVEGQDSSQSGTENQGTVEHWEDDPLSPTDAPGAGDARFSLNSDPVVIEGKSYGAGQVLTVELLGDTENGDAEPTPLTYSLTVQHSVGLTDTDGEPIDWSNSDDRTFGDEDLRPEMTQATGDLNGTGPDRITVMYDSDVTCEPNEDPHLRFRYHRSDSDAGEQPTAIDCDGDNTLVLTFQDGVLDPGSTSDALTYDDADSITQSNSSVQAGHVQDDWGNKAKDHDQGVGVDV